MAQRNEFPKETALNEWSKMIKASGSWEKLTDSERSTFENDIAGYYAAGRISGDFDRRVQQLNLLYIFYLSGINASRNSMGEREA